MVHSFHFKKRAPISLWLIGALLLLLNTTAFAQGNGSDGSRTISSLYYTDSTRTGIDTTSNSGQAQLKVASTSGFAVGQTVLVIQMTGTGVGQYEERVIQTISGGRLIFTSNLTYTYTKNSTSRAQAIKINQYTNVTVNSGGDVTAHAWDGTSGGVVYFKASGTVTVNSGGKIETTSKGFSGGTGGSGGYAGGYGCYGAGGSSGSVNGKHGGGCSGGQCSGGCGNGSGGIGGWGGTGGIGGNGGDPWTNYGTGAIGDTGDGSGGGYWDTTLASHIAAVNNSNSANWGISSGTSLLMGGGGEGGNGSNGSEAGGGGAGGGRGSGNGASGNVGAAGTIGASGGDGGNGGGIVIIHAYTITGSGLVEANGTNSSNGQTGAPGGTGGTAGNAGAGTAGGGGGGRGGNGANGSCAGGGGAGGSVYISVTNNAFTGSMTKTGGSNGTQGNGGAGGNGGTGGNGSGFTGQKGRGGDGGNGGSGATGGAAGTAGADGTSGAANSYTAAANGSTGSTDNTNCGIDVGQNGKIGQCLVAYAGSDVSICNQTSTTLNATGGGTYAWSPSTGLSATNIYNPVASPTVTTTYTVTVTSTGCPTTTDAVVVTVFAKPVVIVAPDDTVICRGNSVNLLATGASTYTWSPSTFLSASNISNPVSTPTATISYNVFGTDGNGCKDTASAVITVNPVPNASAGADEYITIGYSTTIGGSPTAIGGTTPYTYTWSPSTNLSSISVANPTASPTVTLSYIITVRDSNLCIDKDTMIVNLDSVIAYAKLTKQLNGGYHNTILQKLYFRFDEEYNDANGGLDYKVYNASNQVQGGLASKTVGYGPNKYELNVSSLSSGIYILEVTNDKKERWYLRFYKQ